MKNDTGSWLEMKKNDKNTMTVFIGKAVDAMVSEYFDKDLHWDHITPKTFGFK